MNTVSTPPPYPHRTIKSWVRRETTLSSKEQDFLDCSPFALKSLEDLIAKMHQIVNLGKPLFLDMGCGDGQSTLQLAKWAPDAYIFGIEMHTPGLLKCLLKAHSEGLSNVFLFQGDILDVLEASESLIFDRMHLYFSDPWPKSHHHKRRLVQLKFLEALKPHMSSKTIVHIATDWAPYSEHIRSVLNMCQEWLNYRSQHPSNTINLEFKRNPTKYEKKGLAKGHVISEFYINLSETPNS